MKNDFIQPIVQNPYYEQIERERRRMRIRAILKYGAAIAVLLFFAGALVRDHFIEKANRREIAEVRANEKAWEKAKAIMPKSDPKAGDVLVTDGSGGLTWTAPTISSGTWSEDATLTTVGKATSTITLPIADGTANYVSYSVPSEIQGRLSLQDGKYFVQVEYRGMLDKNGVDISENAFKKLNSLLEFLRETLLDDAVKKITIEIKSKGASSPGGDSE